MNQIYLDNYWLHSLTDPLPTMAHLPLSGLGAPDIRLDTYSRPGEHGALISRSLYGSRVITLQGSIHNDTAYGYLLDRQELESAVALQMDENNLPIPRTLRLVDLNNNEFRVYVVPQKFVLDQTHPTHGQWFLESAATDWRIYSETQSTGYLTLPQSGGITFPVTFSVRFGASSGGSSTVPNLGTAETHPIVVISGPVANPVITNATTGESLALLLTLVAGEQVTIDMQARTIVQGTSTNRMSAKMAGSTFWSLQPGFNTISLSGDVYDAGRATVTFRSAFVGI